MVAAPISVIIPAHNEEEFLAEAIRSVYAQTLQPAEIIVIADDCTDRTAEIAAELGARVLEQNRRNMAAGLNLGVSASTQPWIALLDVDDFWNKRKLALQWQAIQSFPKAALISCDLVTLVDSRLHPVQRRYRRERWRGIDHQTINRYYHYLEIVPGELLTRINLGTPTVMLRRDVFSRVGLFAEELIYGQALELFARVMAHYPIVFVERSLVYHRRHEHNHTHASKLEEFWSTLLSIVDRMLKKPELYPKRAGQAYREQLKESFLFFERQLANVPDKGDGPRNQRSSID